MLYWLEDNEENRALSLKDFIIRFPLWSFIFRPIAIEKENIIRQKNRKKWR